MNIAESKRVTAPEAAQNWLARFAEASQSQDAHAAAALFLADGLWRDVLAFTWTIETMSGRAAIEAALRQTLARTKPTNFHIPPKRTPPRWVSRAGTDSIEAIFEFETAFGPAHGIVRLVPDPQTPSRLRAWTLLTNLQELRGHEEAFKRRARGRFNARLRRRQLARPPRQGARLRRSRSGGARGRRRPGGLVDRRALATTRRRYADRRPARTHRRQLAQALPLADAAQRSARQSPALHAVSAEFSGLHSEGQAGELVRVLRRSDGAEFLDRHRARRRQLRRCAQAMVGDAHAAPTAARVSCIRAISSSPPASAAFPRRQTCPDLSTLAAPSCIPARSRTPNNGAARRLWCSAPAPAATTSRRSCTRTAPTSP